MSNRKTTGRQEKQRGEEERRNRIVLEEIEEDEIIIETANANTYNTLKNGWRLRGPRVGF